MKTYIFIFVTSLVLSIFLTPFVVMIAHRVKAIDMPSFKKIHKKPVPRFGGVGIFISFWLVVLIASFFPNLIGDYLRTASYANYCLFFGSLAALLLGIYDDIVGANAFTKLSIQISIALVLYILGFQITRITNPFGSAIYLGWFSAPVTVLWIVGIMNAVNLIDGLDGLATGVALIASLSLVGVSLILDHPLIVIYLICLSGALMGFLKFNFNPAKIFLGDSGSMFLGFLLATTSIMGSQKSSTLVAIFIPLLVFAVPIFDTSYAFFRRIVRGAHPFKGDKEHVHHSLLKAGMSHRGSVLMIYLICFGLGALAFVISFQQNERVALLFFLVGVFSLFFLKGLLDIAISKKIITFDDEEENQKENFSHPADFKKSK